MQTFGLLFRSPYVSLSYCNPLVPEKRLDLKLSLCENNQQILFRHRASYDMMEIRYLSKGMKEGQVFIGVGSNIGIYAVTIAQAFPDAEIIAFEPLPTNFLGLKEIVKRNGAVNCRFVNGAVSNAGEPFNFYINPIHDGGGSVVAPDIYRTGDVKIDAVDYRQQHPDFDP